MHDCGMRTVSGWRPTAHDLWGWALPPSGRIVRWQRGDWLVVVGLFVLTLGTRWPLRVVSLEEVDSANYALAVREFNLAKHQPQPPGYLFFVEAVRFAQLWIPDPIEALTAVQVTSGALAIPLFYALLRPGMPPVWGLSAALLVLFNSQVWFQHVRPMEDAYAFLWLLGSIYAFVRSLGGDARWWIGGMAILGLGMGAKQVLPGFLLGLWGRTLWECWRHGRFAIIALGILGSLIASLTWFIPLSLHVGTVPSYVTAALSQLAWGREHEALLFNWTPARVASQWRTTAVLVWGPASLALPMWGLTLLGAWQVIIHHASLRWLLWLVLPTLVLRFLFLGYWPRFTLYYLPFLMPLVVVGFSALLDAILRVSRRLWAAFGLEIPAITPKRPSLWRLLPGMVLLLGWVALQVRYIGPTLLTLHFSSFPVVEAVKWIRQHYDPTTTIILSDNDLISRHLDFYAATAGFFSIYEPHLYGQDLRVLPQFRHVLKIQREPVQPPSSIPLGGWALTVPHWRDLSLRDDFLRVNLYEFRDSFVFFSGWHGPELDVNRIVRWSKPEGSQIHIFRVPPDGRAIRLQGVIMVLGERPSLAVEVRVNGEPMPVGEQSDRIDLSWRVYPMEATGGQAVVEIRPGCAFTPTQIDRSSNDQRRLGCFQLTDLTIEP
jgi:hypothetical protein